MSIYLELTGEFNRGRLRAIVTSGQAVVLYRLSVMSKDGDWILREDQEALDHVLSVLEARGAVHRLGAPLALPWMEGGWSSHFEFPTPSLRVRTDFFTRPPRVSAETLARLWAAPPVLQQPVVDLETLARMKATQRERDWAVIGEIARLMPTPREQLLFSRSARDLIALRASHPDLAAGLGRERPVLGHIAEGRDALEVHLDAERRRAMALDEERLDAYANAARPWRDAWPRVQAEIEGLPLRAANAIVVERARGILPTRVTQRGP